MADKIEPEEIAVAIDGLFQTLNSIQLATLNKEGEPESSYTPYMRNKDRIYVFISELAGHTQNLRINPAASLFLIEDETLSKNIFARKRITLKANASFIERDEERWAFLLDLFEDKQGNTVSLLKGLNDFCLVEFEIQSGTYVQGFGQAFRFDGMEYHSVEQVTGK